MSSQLRLKIVTPERVVVEQAVSSVTVPTRQGQITVLPHHIPLVSLLMPGELSARDEKGSETAAMAVSGGFIEVSGNTVVILADTAERVEEIDEARAESARERAKQLLAEVRSRDDVAYATLVAKMEKELARLRVARKRKAGHLPRPEA